MFLKSDKTFFKSLVKPSCINLLIANRPQCFQNATVFSTDLSDFRKMVFTVLKTSFSKAPPKEMFYRDYRNFKLDEKIFVDVLNEQAPFKKKLLRSNHAPCMTKRLRKAIKKRSGLKSNYLKIQTQESFKSYKKQRNFFSRLYKKEPKNYYSLKDFKNINDNRLLWRTIRFTIPTNTRC